MANKFWSSLLTPTRCSRSIETLFFTLWVTKSVFSYQEFMMGRKNLTSLLYWPMFSSWALQIRLIKDRSVREGHGLLLYISQFSSVQFSHSVMSNSLWPHELQHARPPCPSPTPGVYLNSCPLSRWCHPTISSSVIPFSSCLLSFPASGSFPMSQFFTSGGQSIGVSASTSVLPMNTQDWFPLGWTGWIPFQSKELSRIFKTTVQKHQFFCTQLSI